MEFYLVPLDKYEYVLILEFEDKELVEKSKKYIFPQHLFLPILDIAHVAFPIQMDFYLVRISTRSRHRSAMVFSIQEGSSFGKRLTHKG